MSTCTKSGGCTSRPAGVVLDANWRWIHDAKQGSYTNCYTGNEWDSSLCPDPATCSSNCALDGGDYPGTYGIQASGNSLKLGFVTKGATGMSNIGSRTYLMDDDSNYYMFKLKNKEFTFTVDVSNLPCGLNGALYFVEMDKDGGMSKYPTNKAGAKYGTGYCDAQCPHDIKFINGMGNMLNWTTSPTDKNAGAGKYGTCCPEMDIWEANSMATAYTAHPCSVKGQTQCSGVECGDIDKGQRYEGVCDKDGCDFNSWRLGDETFFGSGSSFKVDTTKPVTAVTQFITTDGTDTGDLKEIRRVWVQDGKAIGNPQVTVAGKTFDSLTDDTCDTMKATFGDIKDFEKKGGMKAMGESLERGVVLVMSLWDDHAVNMLWLDSDFPLNKPKTTPGVARGPCSTDSGKPTDVESNHPGSSVTYSDIKVGEIGSTFSGGPSPPSPTPPAPTPPSPTPSGCPGGSLSACIGLCPSDPPVVYAACVKSCAARCAGEEEQWVEPL